ncbi:DNA-binding CsgD family transcriptional regulator [Kribbella shirazensis]|uniref:DNA-binding CsgD family transcriptional regulator n=1 Tax=Kribbella shirazensis TaxID=1105143 RepID=A0A7X5VHJ9_9ACTN|nr:DNA-binding CsgD family transcriptional regulator [Kribbella shirazensis]
MAGLRAGQSAALVVRGDAGIGKTALLDYLEQHAGPCRVVRASGVEAELELAYAGLHQLCAQLPEQLPDPRYEALGTAFGLTAGVPPDRFQVGLAMLNLLTDVADDAPLICLIDDAQWLDKSSAQTLAFVARRLLAERVALVFAVRTPHDTDELAGLPELRVSGLDFSDARALLGSVLTGLVDDRVRDRFVAETQGNPLALIELPRGLTPGLLAGGFGLPAVPEAGALTGRIEQEYRNRLEPLPAKTRLLLLTAAADPIGDAALLWRAAARLGIGADAAAPAEAAGLIEIRSRVRFRHPLIRSVVYQAASAADRRSAHGALADATEAIDDPDRKVWHRAHAAVGLDESVASDLMSAAERARTRGGVAAAAAFLERAAELTPDAHRRAERALTAAAAKFRAGEAQSAYELVGAAEIGPLTAHQRAHLGWLRAQIVFARRRSRDAAPLLLAAADRLETLDDPMARAAYLEALGAAIFGGRLSDVEKAAGAACAARPAADQGPMDLLLNAVATRFTEGYVAAVPLLRRALAALRAEFAGGEPRLEEWLWLACPVAPEPIAPELWDDEAWHDLAVRAVELGRRLGALSVLPMALSLRAGVHLHAGEFAAAAALVSESDTIAVATGRAPLSYTQLMLAAWRGDEDAAVKVIEAGVREATESGEGRALALARCVTAVLYNGLGRYHAALEAARQAVEQEDLGFYGWSLAELVEAAARSGERRTATEALRHLEEHARAAGTDWSLGVLARSAALLAEGQAAEALYHEAVERLGRTRIAVHLARAHLVYGEWLRREGRRQDARFHLRIAYNSLADMGATAYAERARQELAATGETARRRQADARNVLTPQEAQIAQLAAEGLTNREIGGQLFLSHHTVEWHLRKVFSKLAVTSRRQLNAGLIADSSPLSTV